jgi:hypothetical protein
LRFGGDCGGTDGGGFDLRWVDWETIYEWRLLSDFWDSWKSRRKLELLEHCLWFSKVCQRFSNIVCGFEGSSALFEHRLWFPKVFLCFSNNVCGFRRFFCAFRTMFVVFEGSLALFEHRCWFLKVFYAFRILGTFPYSFYQILLVLKPSHSLQNFTVSLLSSKTKNSLISQNEIITNQTGLSSRGWHQERAKQKSKFNEQETQPKMVKGLRIKLITTPRRVEH